MPPGCLPEERFLSDPGNTGGINLTSNPGTPKCSAGGEETCLQILYFAYDV